MMLSTGGFPPLTKLGQKTLDGYIQRWGDEKGRAHFMDAVTNGVIERGKMLAPSPTPKESAES